MAQKYGLIIDITRADGCGSDLLEIADELTGNLNQPTDSEIPEGMAKIWMNMEEVEQGQNNKIKMDYIPKMFPLADGSKPCDILWDDPTKDYKWGDLEDPNSCAAKFAAENADEITDCTPEGLDYKILYYKLPKPFIAGEVIGADGECVKGAKVTLTAKSDGKTVEQATDFFGDFQFLRLTKGEEYTVQIEGTSPITVVLDEAKDLGTIKLA
ncbi:MAG: hypothetical protein E7233_02665 [Lachnospiraceae bacterium]|nr:hypothetical protein [Lachnospiraceae bacterium]